MKSPRGAVCGTQGAWGLCVGSAAGWPPSSSLSAALSHAALFICLLNGFGFGPHSLLCKQTVWIRLPCPGPTHTARVGRSGLPCPPPQPRHGAALTLIAEGIQVSGAPTAPSALLLPPCCHVSGERLCPGRWLCPREQWGLPAPGRAAGQPLLSAGNLGTAGQLAGTACPGQG